jgi:nucleoside phosphorylase
MLLIVAATEPELRGADDLDHVEVLACGVGPVDAAAMTAARLAHEPRPAALLHVGIAGARRGSGLAPGTVVIGDCSTYCDTTSELVARELHPDPVLLQAARAMLPDAHVATIGTSADVSGSHGCDVEAMEGFGVLHAATLAGVPALEVRAVSNEIEEDDRTLWRFDLGLTAIAEAIPHLAAALSAQA